MAKGFVKRHTGRELAAERFQQELNHFAGNGYRFSVSGWTLREGTQHEAFDAFAAQFNPHYSYPSRRRSHLLDEAIKAEIVKHQGNAFAYGATMLGKTRREAEQYLKRKKPVADEIISAIQKQNRLQDGYFEMPTGVGKTALFLSLIQNYMTATESLEPSPRMLIVVPSKKLVEQTEESFAKFMPGIAPLIGDAVDDNGESVTNSKKHVDYGKSGLGVAYSRRKVLDKPIVITTYQSLLRDLKREEKDRVFRPDDFRFVVFDEAHALTGEQFGLTAKEFKGKAIRLAFTATPSYSEQKTLREHFPHRYYHLTTGEAMRRKDLCDVRPILVKTNYTIDRSKLETKLLGGERKYNRRQLGQLLNVAARNQAAVDTYLSYCDPDTGEQLFGRQGLVFCAGVTHAKDVAHQFNQALEDRAKDDEETRRRKASARKWLHDNDIELAAHIEGRMSNQERDNIFRRHAEGKILVLCSDQLIKEGYDRPEDSFCMNLADTLSIVEAKQRNGRVFRLDENDQYKFATTFDFVDEERYAAAGRNRQLLPVFCPEILGNDWEFRLPMKRPSHVTRRLQGNLPEPVLQHSGFDVICDPQRVRNLCDERQRQRKEAVVPPAKPNWLSSNGISANYGGDKKRYAANIEALRHAKLVELQAAGMDDEAATQEVEEKWVAWAKPSSGIETWHISPEGLKELIRDGEIRIVSAPSAKQGWLSGTGISKQYGGTPNTYKANLKSFRDAKLAELQMEGMDKEMAAGEVSRKWVIWAKPSTGSGKETWHVSPEGLKELIRDGEIRIVSVPFAKPDWLSSKGISKQYGHKMLTANIEAFRGAKLAELQAAGMDEEVARQEVERKWVAWAKPCSGIETWHISPEGQEELIRTGRLRNRKADKFSGR